MKYTRRQIMRAFALGGAVVAGELWIPGQRLISLPSPRLIYDYDLLTVMLESCDVALYRDVWIAAYLDGGAVRSIASRDGITWQHIRVDDVYDGGAVQVTLTHQMMEDMQC